jgi:hypothetical protein
MRTKTKTLEVGLASLIVLGGPIRAVTQLAAPTALSDFAKCSRHTCTWVPWSTHKTFKQDDLTYTVEVNSKDDATGDFVLRRADTELLRTPLLDLSASTSVVWSDDKKSFAVTWSNGGASGWFDVRVFRIEGESVTEFKTSQKAFEAFKTRHWCEARGDNIQAYQWLPNSRDLVLILSVYPTSDCGKDMGHTEGYVVDAATGEIRQHWGLKRLEAYMRSHPEW